MPTIRTIRDDIGNPEIVVDEADRGVREDPLAMINRLIWFVVGMIEAALALRFIFRLFGAAANEFVRYLYSFTEPFVRPFYGIFPNPSSEGMVLELATLVAMLIVSLVGAAISALLDIITPNRI